MKQLVISSTLLMLGILAAPLHAGNAENGKKLHDAKCMGCHDTRQYTRPNRIIHTYEDLRNRVEFCDSASGANFTSEQFEDVVTYLNTTFYKFKE